MQRRVQHFIETRFSLRLPFRRAAFSEEWLQRRVELWRRFCAPSIAAQTLDDFCWLVFCDETTDTATLDALRSHEAEVPALEVAVTGGGRTPEDHVRSRLHPDTEVLITTCLDSDDALVESFVESCRAYVEPFARSSLETMVLNFARGYRFDVDAATLHEDRMANSSFPSLFERPHQDPVQTVLSHEHIMLRHVHPTHQDESMHAWLIAVHEGNVVNRIREQHHRSTHAGGILTGFPLAGRPTGGADDVGG